MLDGETHIKRRWFQEPCVYEMMHDHDWCDYAERLYIILRLIGQKTNVH